MYMKPNRVVIELAAESYNPAHDYILASIFKIK